LVLGEVEETIYVVEEDEDEEETVRVSFTPQRTNLWGTDRKLANTAADNSQEIGDAVCERYVSLCSRYLRLRIANPFAGDSVVLISPQAPS
jgi:hypothetical protein